MRLRDLLDIDELGLALLSGEHALDRPIRWVYLTELVETGRYLSGNELVLTGLIGPQIRERPEDLVDELVEAGATALGVGLSIRDAVPERVREACARRGLPLLEVGRELSFGTISEIVTRRLTTERAAGLAAVLGRHRRLISSVAEGSGLDSVFKVTQAELGRSCWVVSPTGRVVVGPGHDLPDARALAAERLTAARLPHVVSGPHGPRTLLPVNSRAAHPAASWFLVCEGEPADVAEEARESAHELAALAALERARLAEGHKVERRLLAELLDPALTDPAEITARMRTCGLDPAQPYAAVCCELSGPAESVEVLRELIPEAGAVASLDGEAVTLVPREGQEQVGELVARLREDAELLEPGLARERLTVGVSAVAKGASLLRGAVEEARHARRLAAARRTGRAHVVTSDEIHSHALLLATVPDGVRRSFRDRLLRPLHAYDAEHHSDLVRTLTSFLDHSGSWNRCATALHLHVNTLRYRIRRIEELTGRDLSTLEDRVDFFLALRAM